MTTVTVPVRSADVESVEIEGSVLLFDGEMLRLLPGTSATIWSLLDGWRTVDDVAKLLGSAFPDEASTIAADVDSFIAAAVADAIVVWQPQRGSGWGRPAHVAWTRDGDHMLLADMRTGVRRLLSPSGARVWELLMNHGAHDAVLAALRRDYPEAPASMAQDVSMLLADLVEDGLLEPRGTDGGLP